MKKIISVLLLGVLAGFAALAETPVEKRESIVLGAATFDQEDDYTVFELLRLELYGIQPAAATATVKRVSSGLTNTLATIVVTSGTGVATNLSEYLFRGDDLVITGAGTNAGTSRATGRNWP